VRLCLVGADFEENLGVGMIAAAAEDAGHPVSIVPFNHVGETSAVVQSIVAARPDVVGLSIQFQHRVYEFLGLGRRLREAGFRRHLTCGGQFPSLAWKEALEPAHELDSVVLHEGERTIVDLLDGLAAGRRPGEVCGLAIRGDDGAPLRTAARSLVHNLDELPLPKRYRSHSRHLGVPLSSRSRTRVRRRSRVARRTSGCASRGRTRGGTRCSTRSTRRWPRSGSPRRGGRCACRAGSRGWRTR
jgi:radical SAM superfamily enzyme YgiQ (UPF0313 family)